MKIIEIIVADLFEGISKDELIKNLQQKRQSNYLDMVLKKMHELVQSQGDRQSIGGAAFEISKYLGGTISGRELEKNYIEKYGEPETAKVPAARRSLLKKKYSVAEATENNNIINNRKGWGAVPNNQEVDYLGLRVKMSPKIFIELAAPLGTEPSEKIVQHIEQGGTIGSPFLTIKIPEAWEDGDFTMPARVVGHEGRNRMLAIAKVLGNSPIETHLFFSEGLRNRHITDEFKKNLNRWLFKEKSRSIFRGPLFSLTESMLEWGRVVKGVNTTVDVGPNEIKRQTAKFGNTVDKDGVPPRMTTTAKSKSTTVKHHTPIKEAPRYTAAEWAIIEGGHTLEETVIAPKQPGKLFAALSEMSYQPERSRVNETDDLLEKIFLSEAMKDYASFGPVRFQEPNKKNDVDGIILGSRHYEQRETQRLIFSERKEVSRMFKKFVNDPISTVVTSADPEEGKSFCLYNDDNLGVAVLKKEFMFDKANNFFTGYLITTVSQNLLLYSNQTLFKVPNDPSEPCRLFNAEDLASLTPAQRRGLGPQGRFRR